MLISTNILRKLLKPLKIKYKLSTMVTKVIFWNFYFLGKKALFCFAKSLREVWRERES